MGRALIAPYNFVPRSADELQFSKDDLIFVYELGEGWCWGYNVSQGGKGRFPKRYTGNTRICTSTLNRVILDTASVCSSIDMLIARSTFLTSDDDRLRLQKRETTLSELGPVSYFSAGCTGGIWEGCVKNFVGAFDDKRVKASDYMFCIRRLRTLAERLDRHIPLLTDEISKYAKMLPSVLENALCMHKTIRGIIEIAEFAFERWKSLETLLPSPPLGMMRTPTNLSGSTLRSLSLLQGSAAESVIVEPSPTGSPFINLVVLGYPTLRNLTFFTSLIACALQAHAYSAATLTAGGAPTDPDFYTGLQSMLMQLLTTYTSIVPAVRSRALRGAASVFWVALLSAAAVLLNVASVAVYVYDTSLSPFLSFFGAVVQAVTVLQLAIRVEAAVARDVVDLSVG